jgi:hypothetical protein
MIKAWAEPQRISALIEANGSRQHLDVLRRTNQLKEFSKLVNVLIRSLEAE